MGNDHLPCNPTTTTVISSREKLTFCQISVATFTNRQAAAYSSCCWKGIISVITSSFYRCYHDKPVLRGSLKLHYLGLAHCTCLYSRLITKGTRHSKPRHGHLLHPHPQWPQILTPLILLAEDPASEFEDALFLVFPFWLMIDGEGKHLPLVALQSVVEPEIYKRMFVILWLFLNLWFFRSHLLDQDGPGVSHVEGQHFSAVDSHPHYSRPAELSVDLSFQQHLVGLQED